MSGGIMPTFQRVTTVDALGSPIDPRQNAAGESYIGHVGGTTKVITAAFTRPADTAAYAVGDLIAPSTTPGVGNVITIAGLARVPSGTGRIIRLRVATNQAAFAGTLRIHLFKTAVAPTVSDNGALAGAVPNYITYYGMADVTLANGILSDGSKGFMAFAPPIAFDVPDGTSDIYYLMETRTAFTPASGQRFSVTVEADLD